jgi:superfamily II DNA or RNA helicase
MPEIDLLDFDPLDLPAWEDAPAPRSFCYRDYQDECIQAVESAWPEFKRLLIVLATGGGKTIVFTRLAQLETSRGGKVLILAHTEELLDQAADKLQKSTGLFADKEKAEFRASLSSSIVVASVQTLCRDARLSSWNPKHFSLVIVDEAHRTLAASYLKILEHFKTAKVLGVTATADRGDKKNLAQFYEHVPFQFGLLPAVHAGWLVRPRVHQIPFNIDLKGVKTRATSNGNDVDATEVSHRIAPFLQQIAGLVVSHTADRGQGIMFLPSVATAVEMACSLNHYAPGSADYVSGDCPYRAEKIERFKAGGLRVLVNAMLLTEGFDHDAVDWICCLRPTKIRSLYAQIVGRGTRPLNSIVGRLNSAPSPAERTKLIAESAKPDLKILDFLWLTDSLDLVTPFHLVARNSAVAERMRESTTLMQGDLIDMEAQADRDLLASLEKAVVKNRKKKARVIDPLELAVTLHDEEIANYEPSSRWEFQPPSSDQQKLLSEYGIDGTKVATAGLAFKIINKARSREQHGLCTFRQMEFFDRLGEATKRRMGLDESNLAFLTRERATKLQREQLAYWRSKK